MAEEDSKEVKSTTKSETSGAPKKNKTLIIVGIIAVIVIGWVISTNNGIVQSNEKVSKEYAQVETQLQRRLDLIPNLVSTVKGYAAHEEGVFTEIANARGKLSGAISSGDIDEVGKANDEVTGALGRLLAISEAYPELKADKTFIGLQDELAGTENRINQARQTYNDTVGDYNTKIKLFPASVIAGLFGHSERDYFEADAGAENAPKVDFN